jgi:hypothetical protein
MHCNNSMLSKALQAINCAAVRLFLSRIKHFLLSCRRRKSIIGFFNHLDECGCRYVVLRWFEGLPDIKYGVDIDILVHDDDADTMKSLLKHYIEKEGIFYDLYSVNGTVYDWEGSPYYPPFAACGILERAEKNEAGIMVPSKEDYFFSLAYHVLYHKGVTAGLPVSKEQPPIYTNPRHDYKKTLLYLAQELGLDINIDMNSLKQLLTKKGWLPTSELMEKISMGED